jgi:hypothetical protein
MPCPIPWAAIERVEAWGRRRSSDLGLLRLLRSEPGVQSPCGSSWDWQPSK